MLTSSDFKAILAIVVVTSLLSGYILLSMFHPEREKNIATSPVIAQRSVVTFQAFGDVNLGRKVGQRILKGEIHFPFNHYSISEDSADIVFANLECPISFQNGETGHPRYNLIFTAPPEAIQTLVSSGIDIVSTANNHALDYGFSALKETIDRLTQTKMAFVGTAKQKESLFLPLIYEKNNIKFAIFGVTAFVNIALKDWRHYVASPDTVELLKSIRAVRDSVDIVVMSYHGGAEYVNRPSEKVVDFAEWSINNGVDIFLGHHPHVTYGIQRRGNRFIVHSLGNFVFYQPQHYWTQRSYSVLFSITKTDSVTSIELEKVIPINVSLQTRRLTDSLEREKLKERTQWLSNIDLSKYWN